MVFKVVLHTWGFRLGAVVYLSVAGFGVYGSGVLGLGLKV